MYGNIHLYYTCITKHLHKAARKVVLAQLAVMQIYTILHLEDGPPCFCWGRLPTCRLFPLYLGESTLYRLHSFWICHPCQSQQKRPWETKCTQRTDFASSRGSPCVLYPALHTQIIPLITSSSKHQLLSPAGVGTLSFKAMFSASDRQSSE